MLELVGTELAGADEDRLEAVCATAGDVALEVVSDHPGELGIGVERRERRAEERRAGLAEHGRLDAGDVLQARNEGARIQTWAVGRLPPLVAVQAVELGSGFELVEGAV